MHESKETSMKTLLQIRSSIFSDNGQSSQLATQFIDALRERDTDLRVTERDLAHGAVAEKLAIDMHRREDERQRRGQRSPGARIDRGHGRRCLHGGRLRAGARRPDVLQCIRK